MFKFIKKLFGENVEKVYCNDCKHVYNRHGGLYPEYSECRKNPVIVSDPICKYEERSRCIKKNRNNKCKDFELKHD